MRRRMMIAAGGSAALLLGMARAQADESPRAVLEGYLAAWNAHDADAAASYFAEDVVYYDASVGRPIQGRVQTKAAVIDNFLNAVPDAAWIMKDEPATEGGKVVFEWEFSGTNTGAWADGTAATGKAFRFPGASVVEVENGKIKLQSDYYDALGFYKQLGLM